MIVDAIDHQSGVFSANLDIHNFMKIDMRFNELQLQEFEAPAIDFNPALLRSYDRTAGAELRSNLASFLEIDKEAIQLCNGADDGLFTILNFFSKAGLRIFCPEPSYLGYSDLFRMVGAKVHFYEASEVINLIDSLDHTNLILICNPENPTGQIIDDLSERLATARCVCLIDEAYIEFLEKSGCANLSTVHENIFVVRSFSKFFGSPGLRLGYFIGHESKIKVIKDYCLRYPVSNFAIQIGIRLLRSFEERQEKMSAVLKEASMLRQSVNELGFVTSNSVTYFFSIKMKSCEEADFYQRQLLKHKIVLANYSRWRLLRVTSSTATNNRFFIDSLAQVKHLASVL